MFKATQQNLPVDIAVFSAAVSDFRINNKRIYLMNKFINRDEAMIILKKMLSNKSLIIHSLSVAMVMEEYAKKIDENIDEFYIT